MQFSNNDMDELFRNAAEKYPLKTDNANWDKVAKMLDEAETEKPILAMPFGITSVAVILLIVLAGATWYFIGADSTEQKRTVQNIIPAQKVSNTTKATIAKIKNAADNNISIAVNPSITVNEKNRVNNLRSVPVKMSASGGTSKPADLSLNVTQQKQGAASTSYTDNNYQPPVITKSNGSVEKKTESLQTTNETVSISATEGAEQKRQEKIQRESISKKTEVKAGKEKGKSFYLVAVAGMDKSHVALQKFSKWGNSYGVTAGYSLNSHFSIEAGVLSSTKKYYTGAQYFNVSKLPYSSAAKWKYFDGECRMLEIPVVLRYNFTPTSNAQWFVASGISSYLMREERYDYEYEWYGQTKTGTHEYSNSSENWISSIHVSGGVERKLLKNSSIRVEPYVRIAIKKMGYGDLPISSAGLNIGFRQNIF